MTSIRQECLFIIQELYEMKPTQKFEEVMAAIYLDAIFYQINKKSQWGVPTELNYGAMVVSVFTRYVEHYRCQEF